jgi:hypothetical protein
MVWRNPKLKNIERDHDGDSQHDTRSILDTYMKKQK